MKSSSAAMGFTGLAFLMHVMEDVFDYARNDLLVISSEQIQKVFHALDEIDKSLESIRTNNTETDTSLVANELKDKTGVTTDGISQSNRDEKGQPVIENKVVQEEKSKPLSHIKVPVERLDSLMDLMEELIIDKMQLELIASLEENKTKQIFSTVKHLSRVVSEMQYFVMQARLVPIEQVLARFPRMVRDLAQKTEKEVEFIVEGADTEIDRTVVDQLAQPLVHLIRNAVDHGISSKGRVIVKCRRERDQVIISVEDDGAGINWKKVSEVAINKGLLSSTSDDKTQLQKFLFNPQFSTSETVTETSGRGVGLSVVKEFAEKVGGRVQVESPVGDSGTKFSLELPLSLAIIKALLVRVDNHQFAIPFASVIRSLIIPNEEIKTIADQETFVLNSEDVPLVRLKNVMDFQKLATQEEVGPSEEPAKKAEQLIVLTEGEDAPIGIAIDSLISEQEIIIKPLVPVLRFIKGLSGFTITGEGGVVLVLDPASLWSLIDED